MCVNQSVNQLLLLLPYKVAEGCGRFADTYNCIKTAFHDTDILARLRGCRKDIVSAEDVPLVFEAIAGEFQYNSLDFTTSRLRSTARRTDGVTDGQKAITLSHSA